MRLVGSTHIVAGDARTIEPVLTLLEEEGIRTTGNPDLYVRAYTHFGVDDARDVRERALLKATRGRRVFVVATPLITSEAQNALLKTLEDSPGDALFFIIVPNPYSLLATIRSRAHVLSFDDADPAGEAPARTFLRASAKERLELLRPLLEKDDDDRRDMGSIVTLLSSIERVLAKGGANEQNAAAIRAVYRARAYMTDKGALVKSLLEQVALLVPSMKA